MRDRRREKMLLNRKTQSLPSVFRQQLQFLPAHHVIAVPFPALTQPWGAWQSHFYTLCFQTCCTGLQMGEGSKRQLINYSACILIKGSY